MRLDRNGACVTEKMTIMSAAYLHMIEQLPLTAADGVALYGINIVTLMAPHSDPQDKRRALQASGTFNPRHERVRHALFQGSDFFDPRDLLQLKYETLRALKQEDYSIARAAADFGLSRPTIYQIQTHFERRGLQGLLPAKPGPKNPHKLTAEVRRHLQELLQDSTRIRGARIGSPSSPAIQRKASPAND